MASGAEHYLEAERLLEGEATSDDYATARSAMERAKVHATLALAAATAMAAEGTGVLLYGYGTGR